MGNDDPEREMAGVCEAIFAYLCERPAAADTPRGILEWWLAGHQPQPHLLLVLEALDKLEGVGVVRRIVNFDGNVLFAAGPAVAPAAGR